MVNRIIKKGKEIFTSPQTSILSAASVIMMMIIASRVLGLVRQRVLAHFFTASQLGVFFAAFRLPDLVFEVLVFGTFSSAFIPVFTKLASRDQGEAWELASKIVNIGLVIFLGLALTVGLSSDFLYQLIAPGFSAEYRDQIVSLTRILFLAQGFFVISYVLTGVLESLKRFLIPALAPIFYNIGIIVGTAVFAGKYGLLAPCFGVVIGAFAHFMIQLPLAIKLGFKFKPGMFIDDNVKKIGKLALPRIIEVGFLQFSKTAELFFSSFLSTASYAYYTFGNTIQLLPVGIFGTSIAKAALPTLSAKADSKEEFAKALWKSLYELTFLITPIAGMLIVLRIPIVRLVFGTDIFTWESTVQTGLVVSSFAFGVVFQAANALLARGFYAMHDTKTPVMVSVSTIILTILLDFLFIKVFHTPIWGLALAFSIGAFIQSIALYVLINKRVNGGFRIKNLAPFIKHLIASLASGGLMFFVLKVFDKSVWVKRLSFLGKIEATKAINFQKFVLDTNYTLNLLMLTIVVGLLGVGVYIFVSWLLKVKELGTFANLIKRVFVFKKLGKLSVKEQEPVIPTPTETTN